MFADDRSVLRRHDSLKHSWKRSHHSTRGRTAGTDCTAVKICICTVQPLQPFGSLHSDYLTIQDTQRSTPTDSSPPPLSTSSQADLEFTAQTKKGAKRHKLELMFEAPVDPGALNPRCSYSNENNQTNRHAEGKEHKAIPRNQREKINCSQKEYRKTATRHHSAVSHSTPRSV
jgi:hypothetical protein